MRLDEWLFKNKEIESLERARALVLAGRVLVNDQIISHNGFRIKDNVQVRIKKSSPYYSRAAFKLKGVLQMWDINFTNKKILDIGSAHGGFTQVLLEIGVQKVISLDLSYGQLHPTLRQDERVWVMERTNIYHIKKNDLPFEPDGFTADLSFTTLRKLLPYLKKTLPPMQGVCLFKPQFEADTSKLEKGIVRDEVYLESLLKSFQEFLVNEKIQYLAHSPSPITGKKGNQEYLFWISLGTFQCLSNNQEGHFLQR